MTDTIHPNKHSNLFENLFHISIFIMIATSSLMAIEINGISVNIVGLIPLLGCCYFYIFRNKIIRISKFIKPYLAFLSASVISALVAACIPILNRAGIASSEIKYIVLVIFVYLPILFVVTQSRGFQYCNIFFKYLVYIIRFHALFIVVQFGVYSLFRINISSVFYDQILRGATGLNWNAFVYGINIVLRAAGLNHDPAFASYLMVCGVIFDDNRIFRWIYVICPILAQSRTGFVTVLIVLFIYYFVISGHRLTWKQIRKALLYLAGIIIIIFILSRSDSFVKQFDSVYTRVIGILAGTSSDISTSRHSQYPILALKCWLEELDPIHMIFGVGPRASGLAFVKNVQSIGVDLSLSSTMMSSIWSIECDFAELLLGYGIIGFVLYYYTMIKFGLSKDNKVKLFGWGMIIMGFMYNFSSLSMNIMMIIFIYSRMIEKKNNIMLVNEK